MKNKKIIVLAVLGIAAVVSLFYGLTSSPGRKRPALPATEISRIPQSVPIHSQAAIKRSAVRTKFKSWKRRPFQPAQIPGKPSNLVLNGIIGGKTPKAMIGDSMVGVGGRIGNNRVVAIKKDSVILNDGTKDFELAMSQ
jgi:hypothetical protein